MGKIKTAIAGTGMISHMFAEAALHSGLYDLTAVLSRKTESGEAFASEFGIKRVFTDMDTFLEKGDFSVLYLALPNTLHFHCAAKAIRAGKHVIVEKPAFMSRQEGEKLFELADSCGVLVFEAARHMYDQNFNILKDTIRQIGETTGAVMRYVKYSARYDKVLRGEQTNIFDPAYGGGALNDLGIYLVYVAVALWGKPKDAHYYPRIVSTGADGSGIAILEYDRFSAALMPGKTMNTHLGCEFYSDQYLLETDSVAPIAKMTLTERVSGRVSELAKPIPDNFLCEEVAALADMFRHRENPEVKEQYAYLRQLSLDVHAVMDRLRAAGGLK